MITQFSFLRSLRSLTYQYVVNETEAFTTHPNTRTPEHISNAIDDKFNFKSMKIRLIKLKLKRDLQQRMRKYFGSLKIAFDCFSNISTSISFSLWFQILSRSLD